MPTTKPPDLALEINALESMKPKQLREKYHEVWGEPTRSGNKRFMIKRIAWKLQANAEGDLPERVRQKALAIARDSDLRTTAPRPRNSPPRNYCDARATSGGVRLATGQSPATGTQLTRIYKGQTVVVTVLEDGFAHNGNRYRSLSAASKAITGNHVSGNAFFGLTKSKKTKGGDR